tara:strand:+ start:56342 stop:57733 length:1392 start_codon:yes stop_codon:yes gene_type:complete
MKSFIASRKNVMMSVLACAMLIVPFGLSEFTGSKISSTRNLNEGSSTCFARVGQTFTALMIKDFSSPYLKSSFMSMTGECFAQLNKSFESLYGASYAAAGKPLNKLNSDLFWFHEKTQKLMEMAQSGKIQLTVGSNILTKFSELETLNFQLQEKLNTKIESLNLWKNIWLGLAILGTLFITGLNLFVSRERQREKNFFKDLNDQAKDTLENFNDLEMSSIRTQRLMEKAFRKLQAPFCFELFNQVQTDLLESRSTHLSKMGRFEEKGEVVSAEKSQPENEVEEDVEKVEFNTKARAIIDRMSAKIFSEGIAIEESLEEEIFVKGNDEGLEQLLYNLFSFAVEKSSSSEGKRKINIRSKALGGISYCKVRIADLVLNSEEMEFFHSSDDSESANVNLKLLKELATDMEATLGAKNILNSNGNFSGAEIELVFKRLKPQQKKQSGLRTLMKGSKRDILKAMQSEA